MDLPLPVANRSGCQPRQTSVVRWPQQRCCCIWWSHLACGGGNFPLTSGICWWQSRTKTHEKCIFVGHDLHCWSSSSTPAIHVGFSGFFLTPDGPLVDFTNKKSLAFKHGHHDQESTFHSIITTSNHFCWGQKMGKTNEAHKVPM